MPVTEPKIFRYLHPELYLGVKRYVVDGFFSKHPKVLLGGPKGQISIIFNIFFLTTGLTWEADFWYSDYFFIVLKIYQRNLLKMIPAFRYIVAKLHF